MLDATEIATLAQEATGLDDFGEAGWREGLENLVAAQLNEAALNDLGIQIATGEAVMYLSNRLQVTDWHSRNPEMAKADVRPPIVIIGQGRTGTTILHDLLAQDPANRVPLTWEVDRPCPPPETASYDTDPRIGEVDEQLGMTELLIPGFKTMHPMGARLAQECVRITGSDFRSLIFSTQYRIPSYNSWVIDHADMTSAYRWHRKYLQLLQWRHPGKRWVLKSPAHQWCIGALLAEYPDAVLVQTHRDPVQILASLASLVATLRSMASDATSIAEAADEFAGYVLGGLDRSVDARTDGTVEPGRVIDVQFGEFMSDPFATVGAIYDRLGLELTPEADDRMRRFLADNPRGKHGEHHYSFADTGLDAGEIRERARRYQDFFDVPSEQPS